MKSISSWVSTTWTSFIAFIGAIKADEWLFVIGILSTVISVSLNWYYKSKEYKLKEKYYLKEQGNEKKLSAATCSVAVIISIVLANYKSEIKTSKAGLELIGNAESCMREPYLCPANILTVGIGSTTGKVELRTYSDDEIAKRWLADIKESERCINKHANGQQLPQGVFDAAASITFNVGCTQMKASSFYRYLSSGDYISACNELPKWNKSNGQVLVGLTKRRVKEQALCLNGI